jgi:pimeloyl-ACP methyl ester carboxylesterase
MMSTVEQKHVLKNSNISKTPVESNVPKSGRIERYESKIFDRLSKRFDRYYVNICDKKFQIWTLSINHQQSPNNPIVLIHGVCCSIGLWSLNLDKISESNPIYAFDLLGFGRSSRPNFGDDPVLIEDKFVESIEEWRREMCLTQIILVGHSFGGFLSTAYALKYPHHVKALILVDPWGFAEPKPTDQISSGMRMYIKCGEYFTPASFFRKFGRMGLLIYKAFYSPKLKSKFRPLLGEHNTIYKYVFYANKPKPR